jgi:hypothetical protein
MFRTGIRKTNQKTRDFSLETQSTNLVNTLDNINFILIFGILDKFVLKVFELRIVFVESS